MFEAWADWKTTGNDFTGRSREIELAMTLLPDQLVATINGYYLTPGTKRERTHRLGYSEALLSRQMGRIHLLMADILVILRERGKRQHEKDLMNERLSALKSRTQASHDGRGAETGGA